MLSPRAEHIVFERVVPAILIVLIPLLAAVYIAGEENDERARRAAVLSCERGNALRSNEAALIAYLLRVGDHIQATTKDVNTLAYFQAAREDLVERAVAMLPVDCSKAVP